MKVYKILEIHKKYEDIPALTYEAVKQHFLQNNRNTTNKYLYRKSLPFERTHIYIIQTHKMLHYIKIYRDGFKFTEIKFHMSEVVCQAAEMSVIN